MKVRDIHSIEEFINVRMTNTEGFTTDQVDNKPIRDANSRQIGRLTDADEDFLYGVLYDPEPIYSEPDQLTIDLEEVKNSPYCRCSCCGRLIKNGKIFPSKDNPSVGLCFECY